MYEGMDKRYGTVKPKREDRIYHQGNWFVKPDFGGKTVLVDDCPGWISQWERIPFMQGYEHRAMEKENLEFGTFYDKRMNKGSVVWAGLYEFENTRGTKRRFAAVTGFGKYFDDAYCLANVNKGEVPNRSLFNVSGMFERGILEEFDWFWFAGSEPKSSVTFNFLKELREETRNENPDNRFVMLEDTDFGHRFVTAFENGNANENFIRLDVIPNLKVKIREMMLR
jgi:hypothetical protein